MRLRADTVTSLLALAVSGFILFQGIELGLGRPNDPGSGFILFWTGAIMTALSGVVLGQSLLSGEGMGLGAPFARLRWGKVVYVVVLMVVYATVLETFGFIVSTLALLLVLFKTVDPQSWRVAILGSALTTLGAWAVFVAWLGTQLPVGTLFMAD